MPAKLERMATTMQDPIGYHPLLMPGVVKNFDQLDQHIRAHELSVMDQTYDPVSAPHLMEPLQLKASFDPAMFDDTIFFDLFAAMSSEAERAMNGLFRVYIDDMLSPRYEAEVLYNSPGKGESFQQYLRRATGGRRFGIVVNGAEQWSEVLARLGARILTPIVEAQGLSRTAIEVTLFIGDYGYTPFGIHIDDPYTSVVHFHVGSGAKDMTLFGQEAFQRLHGGRKNCFDPDPLLHHGRTFHIEHGDVFLLPPHYYHIGKTHGFSIGVAYAVSKYPESTIARQVLQRAVADDRFTGSIHEITQKPSNNSDTLAKWLQHAFQYQQAQACSRSHLRYSFVRRRPTVVTESALWARDPDFPLTSIAQDKGLTLFARGNQIRVKHAPSQVRLVDAIPHDAFSVEQLHRKLQGKIGRDALCSMVQQLVALGGLCPVPSA